MWAGVQNVSRPMERCHEMSQMMPSFALVAATLAGPRCPIVVAQWSAVLIGLSLDGGFEPNGSVAVTCSSHLLPEAGFWASGTPGSATEPVYDGKLYSLLPRTASRYWATR